MAGITNAISNLINSIVGAIANFFNVILAILQSFLAALASIARNVLGLFKNLTGFLWDNIVVIGFLAVAFVAYTAYQQRQGLPVPAVGGGGKGAKKAA